MEKIRLYGEIEDIPQEATWDDIERRSRTSPILRQLVDTVRAGHLTREQALIRVALWAANEAVRHSDQVMEWINTHPHPPFVMPNPRQPLSLDTCARCGQFRGHGHACAACGYPQ